MPHPERAVEAALGFGRWTGDFSFADRIAEAADMVRRSYGVWTSYSVIGRDVTVVALGIPEIRSSSQPSTKMLDTEIRVTPELAAEHGLTADEYARIQKILGREPNFTELGIFSVMWSEHCSYKSSKVHLRRLPTRGPQVLQGPGENAGVVDIGDGLAAAFKMESHNHPSYVEPFQGAATGVGGILRDIFTDGARDGPIAVLGLRCAFGA